jgi:hypothetical protein
MRRKVVAAGSGRARGELSLYNGRHYRSEGDSQQDMVGGKRYMVSGVYWTEKIPLTANRLRLTLFKEGLS